MKAERGWVSAVQRMFIILVILGSGVTNGQTPAVESRQQVIEELDFKDVDLRDVVRTLAKKYAVNLYIDNSINKKITIHLSNVTFENALRFIVEEQGLLLEKKGAIYKIVPPPNAEPPPKTLDIDFRDGLLSVDVQDESVREVLYRISQVSGITILPDRQVSGNLSGRIIGLPFEQGLAQLLKSNGYYLKQEGESYTVRRMGFPENAPGASNGGMWVNATDEGIDLEVSNAELKAVLDEISYQTGVNFFLLGEPKGTVNARVQGLSLEEALTFILMESEFTFKKTGDIYLVGGRDNKALVTSKLIRLRHLKVDGIMEMLPQKVTGKAEMKVVKEHNALLVNGSQDAITEIEAVVADIDHPIPQIFFEALVVDFTASTVKDFSIQAGLGAPHDSTRGRFDGWVPGMDVQLNGNNVNEYLEHLGKQFSGINIGKLPTDFFLKIKAMEAAGKANIRSKPQISTLNGHTAELKIGETRYFKLVSETPFAETNQVYRQTTERFQTVEINISLKITPWVSASGEITVEIQPVFNTPGDQVAPDIPPNIQSRSLNSTVRLRDGETIVLGGLIQEVDNETVSRVPILGRIPLLGRLFSNRSSTKIKSELIIYVTPHLSYSDDWLTPPQRQ